jgi:hypothetical protein
MFVLNVFNLSDMGTNQMEKNIQLLGEMLAVQDNKKTTKPGKKVFKKKKLKKTIDFKKDGITISKSKSKNKKREMTTSVKKRKLAPKKKKKRNPKGSPKSTLIKSQSIQLLSSTGRTQPIT